VNQPRVLLVDDEVSSAQVLALILAEQGFLVTVAGDGRQALARLEEASPDVLVTDFMMPYMNGADLVRAVQATPGYEDLPILVITGAPESALRPYRLAYDRFLRKPFGFDAFIDAVRALVDRPGTAQTPM
jgi:CheY-like chemotaxis protein